MVKGDGDREKGAHGWETPLEGGVPVRVGTKTRDRQTRKLDAMPKVDGRSGMISAHIVQQDCNGPPDILLTVRMLQVENLTSGEREVRRCDEEGS